MARNKYPEETVSKIVDVSMKLFLENGYESTSMQDIVDHLGGLSKGAIYHHFKSKEDILVAVMDKIYAGHESESDILQNMNPNATGFEKLKALFEVSIFSEHQNEVFSMAPSFIKNPQMLALQLKALYEESAPCFVQPVIEQGIADGTIETQYPKELAEVLLILVNFWLMPVARTNGSGGLEGRMGFFREILDKLNLPLFDDAMYKRIEEMTNLYNRSDKPSAP